MENGKWMRGYAVELHQLEKEDGGGFLAYIVELGHTACSATGETVEEALMTLGDVLEHVLKVMKQGSHSIPPPLGEPANEPRCQYGSVAEQLRGEITVARTPHPCPWCGMLEGHKDECEIKAVMKVMQTRGRPRPLLPFPRGESR